MLVQHSAPPTGHTNTPHGEQTGHSQITEADGWRDQTKVYIPFLACGDLSGYDSDRSYPLPNTDGGSYRSLDPVQPPIAPSYKTALQMKKVLATAPVRMPSSRPQTPEPAARFRLPPCAVEVAFAGSWTWLSSLSLQNLHLLNSKQKRKKD